jgi:hypothetical protein
MLAYICAAASHCIAVNMAVESPMLVATSSRASGQVGSRLVVGSRVIGVSVSWYQLKCMVVRGRTVATAAK